MNYTQQIFELLGVKPDEEFALKKAPHCFFQITKSLELWSCGAEKDVWFRDTHNTQFIDILTGKFTIIKISKPTKEEQLAIDYARACGCKWMAKDESKKVFAFKNKPIKVDPQSNDDIFGVGMWFDEDNRSDGLPIGIPISFLSWEDEEPYHIRD